MTIRSYIGSLVTNLGKGAGVVAAVVLPPSTMITTNRLACAARRSSLAEMVAA